MRLASRRCTFGAGLRGPHDKRAARLAAPHARAGPQRPLPPLRGRIQRAGALSVLPVSPGSAKRSCWAGYCQHSQWRQRSGHQRTSVSSVDAALDLANRSSPAANAVYTIDGWPFCALTTPTMSLRVPRCTCGRCCGRARGRWRQRTAFSRRPTGTPSRRTSACRASIACTPSGAQAAVLES